MECSRYSKEASALEQRKQWEAVRDEVRQGTERMTRSHRASAAIVRTSVLTLETHGRQRVILNEKVT